MILEIHGLLLGQLLRHEYINSTSLGRRRCHHSNVGSTAVVVYDLIHVPCYIFAANGNVIWGRNWSHIYNFDVDYVASLHRTSGRANRLKCRGVCFEEQIKSKVSEVAVSRRRNRHFVNAHLHWWYDHSHQKCGRISCDRAHKLLRAIDLESHFIRSRYGREILHRYRQFLSTRCIHFGV